jgi:hypothetical protein
MQNEKDMNFANSKLSLSSEEMQEIASKIYQEFSK